MVKGITKRVVIIKGKGNQNFEEAIFIVKDNNVTRDDILKEACKLSETSKVRRRKKDLRLIVCMLFGAVMMGVVWLVVSVII